MTRRFPVEGEAKLNLGCGSDIRPASEGWTNLDGFHDHPAVVKHDLAKFPYPFPDDTFDAVYANHVLEHMPVLFEPWRGVQRDVLFHVMEELHRILRRDGRLHVAVPLGGTSPAFEHPQHYRHWRPEWFRFFQRTHAEANFYHDAHFQMRRLRFNRLGVRARYFLRLGPSRLGIFEHLVVRFPLVTGWLLQPRQEIEAVLTAVKPPSGSHTARTATAKSHPRPTGRRA